PPAGRHRVLAFADPTPAGTGRSLWRSMETSPLRPLPAARKEGRRLLQSYGNQGLLMEGVDATETVLKRASLDDVGLLLFAAHAIVDQQVPRRSAIVLAAGSPGDSSAGEDGLLQPPEISRLRLEGAIVALSGCQSAAGRAIEGEGLLSLARSFFQAGSAAVVGNLWPARDDEAGALFGALYRNLAEGLPLAAALQRAQQKLIRSGAPTEAWAGIVVLGDGDARLPSHGQVESGPGGPAAPGAPHVMAALAVAAGIAAVVLGVSVRRRLLRRR
ncbi:MAG TPA: CHAT domain-containing protein, partial [Candidatus Polarisedimenticolia bacterium]|nr:CHAT domain-containing protein [Candidatus Polarisedimenticolia bacterium]